MRNLLAILIISFASTTLFAQVAVTGRFENKSVADVIIDWSDTYHVDFAYDSYELSQYFFTGNFSTVSLDEALQQLLFDCPYSFKWIDATCIIFPVARVSINAGTQAFKQKIVSGWVRDRLSGEPLPFASIGARRAGVYTTADADGKFTILYDGSISQDTLAIAYLGYLAFEQPMIWAESLSQSTFELVAAHAQLPDVEIRSTSVKPLEFDVGPSLVITSPSLSALKVGFGESDAFRLAQMAPGISAAQENNNGLFIRGSSSDQSLLLFDGFAIYHQDHFFGMFSSVSAYAIKSMRVHKCPLDPVHGGRAGGIVELVGREGDLRNPSTRIEMGTMSISGAIETPLDSAGKASLFVCGRRSLTEWIKGPAYNELFRTLYSASIVSPEVNPLDEPANFDPQLLFQDVNAKLTYRPSFNQQFNVSAYASRDELNFLYADTSSAENVNVSDIRYADESAKSNRGASLRWTSSVTPRLKVITSLGYSQFQGLYFSTDSIRNNLFALDSTQFSFREATLRDWSALHEWQLASANHSMKWGVSLNQVSTSNKRRATNQAEALESADGRTLTFFLGDEWKWNRWVVMPSVRLNSYSNLPGEIRGEPRIAVRYVLRDRGVFFKAAAARSVQFMQRITNQSIYRNVPDEWQLAGEAFPVLNADQLLVGINWTRGNWNADAEAYGKMIRGQVLNASAGQYNDTGFDGFYTGTLRAAGIDVGAQWERSPHKIVMAYSRLFASSNYDVFELRNVLEDYNRAYEAKAAYEWKHGGWNVSLLVLAAGGAPYTALLGVYNYSLPDGSQQPLPQFGKYNAALTASYVRTDVTAGYQWQWNAMRWQATVAVFNAFDTPNYRAVQYSVLRNGPDNTNVNAREIRMLGRIPSLTIVCQF